MVQFDDNLPSLADDDVSIATLDLTIGNLVDIINNHLDAVLSTHLDGTVPSYATDGMLWLEEVTTNEMWILHAHYANGGYDVEIGTIDLGETEGIFKAASINFDRLDTVTDIQRSDYIIIEDSSDVDKKVVKVSIDELETMLTEDSDEVVRVNVDDATPGYLADKLEAGTSIEFETATDDSTLTINLDISDLDINSLTALTADATDTEDLLVGDDEFIISDATEATADTDDDEDTNVVKKITASELVDYITPNLSINDLDEVTIADDDELIVSDTSDSNEAKKITASDLIDYITPKLPINDLDEITIRDADELIVSDTSDSNEAKKITVSDLGGYFLGTSSLVRIRRQALFGFPISYTEQQDVRVVFDSGRVRVGGNPHESGDDADASQAYENIKLTDDPFNIPIDDDLLLAQTSRLRIFMATGVHASALGEDTDDPITFRTIASNNTVQGASRKDDGVFEENSADELDDSDYIYTEQVLVIPDYLNVPIPSSNDQEFPMHSIYDPNNVELRGMYLRRGDGTTDETNEANVRNGYYLPFEFDYNSGDLRYRYLQLSLDTDADTSSATSPSRFRISYMRVLLLA